ncbi:Oxidoreductase FAD-binding domain protein [Kribbella flavida DSM 17836]|uniref:Oxidoreductase FAD-binding domain protein n=1 Tax=Kribbella flavida (strain DSM 17836 / JCM 10339 / NBRC 14399) TaxID=479435 RepID=D2PNS2_KRIFD|nr:ferredoxin reductase [Kribbella flavida]ADB32740.1 Oxidoreductase FAD-binding domain protein [Kribbella flavida DSM 17836]
MERTALRRRLTWQTGTVTQVREETSTARTIVLDLPDWPGHLAGQHLDVRLTAPDGYRASRSYSIASAWTGEGVELTVEQVPDGEVSPYLVEVLKVGDPLEVRGPVGGWFVWRPEDTGPVQLIGGGSGVVPLMAMLRTHAHAASTTPVRLLYSVRRPASVIYRPDLKDLAASDDVDVTFVYTREAPPGEPRVGRIDAELLAAKAFGPADDPTTYVCGPTPFVEAVADLLVAAGHDPSKVRTERFGPTGGPR